MLPINLRTRFCILFQSTVSVQGRPDRAKLIKDRNAPIYVRGLGAAGSSSRSRFYLPRFRSYMYIYIDHGLSPERALVRTKDRNQNRSLLLRALLFCFQRQKHALAPSRRFHHLRLSCLASLTSAQSAFHGPARALCSCLDCPWPTMCNWRRTLPNIVGVSSLAFLVRRCPRPLAVCSSRFQLRVHLHQPLILVLSLALL